MHTQAMYRKEECGDLLSLRYDDTPETTGNDKAAAPQDTYLPQEADKRHPKGSMQAKHRRIRRWDVLWAVHNCAVRFFDMHRRRVQRMDSYLKVTRNPVRNVVDALLVSFDVDNGYAA
jgi:transcription elongation factor SPT6